MGRRMAAYRRRGRRCVLKTESRDRVTSKKNSRSDRSKYELFKKSRMKEIVRVVMEVAVVE